MRILLCSQVLVGNVTFLSLLKKPIHRKLLTSRGSREVALSSRDLVFGVTIQSLKQLVSFVSLLFGKEIVKFVAVDLFSMRDEAGHELLNKKTQ